MFWSGSTWKVKGSEVVPGHFNESHIDCAAYKLSVGDHYYITPSLSNGKKVSNIERLAPLVPYDKMRPWERLGGAQSFTIPPGQFAFVVTEEIVSIPNNCLGFISLRTSSKFQGLINISGFHVDPGYSGKLVYAVYNAGPNNISLTRREKMFPLWLANLDDGSNTSYVFNKKGLNHIPSDVVNKVSAPISSVQDYAERISEIEKKVSFHQFVAGIGATFAFLIIAGATLYFTIFSGSGISN